MLSKFLVDLIKRRSTGNTPSGTNADADVVALDEINYLVRGRHGWFLANQYDFYLGLALVRYGECGEIEHQFLTSLLREGDYVIEVGANIGVHTVGLAKTVGSRGNVVAIEAQPSIFRVLCANLALNGLSNVMPHALGCGAEKGTMYAPVFDYHSKALHNSGGVSLDRQANGTPVPIVALDELVAECPGLRLIKIDVEGMERDVLAGATRLVKKYRPLLYVENDRFENSLELVGWIRAAGYRLWWHNPPLFNPDNFFGESENIYGNTGSINVFCVPNEVSLSVTDQMQELTDSNLRAVISERTGRA